MSLKKVDNQIKALLSTKEIDIDVSDAESKLNALSDSVAVDFEFDGLDEPQGVLDNLDTVEIDIDADFEDAEAYEFSEKSIDVTVDSDTNEIQDIENLELPNKEVQILALDLVTTVLEDVEGLELSDKEIEIIANEVALSVIEEVSTSVDTIPNNKEIEIDADTGEAVQGVNNLIAIVDTGLIGSIKQTITNFVLMGQQGVGAFTGIATSIGGTNKALGLFKIALATTGVGVLVVALGSLVTFFTKTQRGADIVKQAMDGLGAIFAVITDRVSAFGEIIFNAISDPQQAIKDFGNFLKEFIIDRFVSLIQGVTGLGSAMKLVFEGEFSKALEVGTKATKDLVNGFVPLDAIGETFSGLADEISAEGKAAAQLAKDLQAVEKKEIDLITVQAKRRTEIDKLRLVAEDETKSADERVKALERANNIAIAIFEDEKEIAKERARISQAQVDLGNSVNAELEENERIQARVIELDGEESKLKKRLQTRLNSLIKERDAENKTTAETVNIMDSLIEKRKQLEQSLNNAIAVGDTAEIDKLKVSLNDVNLEIESLQQRINDFNLSEFLTKFNIKADFSLDANLDNTFEATQKQLVKDAEDRFKETVINAEPIANVDLELTNFGDTLENLDLLKSKIQELAEEGTLNLEVFREFGVSNLDAFVSGFQNSFESIDSFINNSSGSFEDYATLVGDVAGNLASAFGQETEAFRVLAATQAGINSFLAFTQVLSDPKLPTLIKIPTATAVLLSGLAQISKIYGAEDGVVGLTDSYNKAPGKSDTIPFLLAKGETVIDADSTRLNRDSLELINKGVDIKEHHKQNFSNQIDLTETNDYLYNINKRLKSQRIDIFNKSNAEVKYWR